MMPSPSIDHRPRTNRSRRRSAGNARTRARCSILCARAPQMSLPKLRQPLSRRTPRQNKSPNPSIPNSSSQPPRPNPHSVRGTAPHPPPRFRALALFGRRSHQRVDSPVMPATKNLHNSRHCNLASLFCFNVRGANNLCPFLGFCTDKQTKFRRRLGHWHDTKLG